MKTLDPTAPIEPGVGMAGLKLRTHISEYFEIIGRLGVVGDDRPKSSEGEARLQSPYHIAYNLAIGVTMVFNVINGRLYKLVADTRYNGSLLGSLRTGMPFGDATHLEPRLSFDEAEEIWKISGIKGLAIDTDGSDRTIKAISVYVVELEDALEDSEKLVAFEKGQWS